MSDTCRRLRRLIVAAPERSRAETWSRAPRGHRDGAHRCRRRRDGFVCQRVDLSRRSSYTRRDLGCRHRDSPARCCEREHRHTPAGTWKGMRTMTTMRSREELTAPLDSVDVGRLVFARGAAHLTIGVDGSMEDLCQAHFDGKTPGFRIDEGTVTVTYRPSFHRTDGTITLSGRIPGPSRPVRGCPTSWPTSRTSN